ncbi:SDR family oxidoreductase [Pseudonocardia sp. HH130629-09]|uniref:SDR family oxidoreductase n=1 Tax=Pseudonocardia sp. HH130629-09 TaxID=1641402 RepID=UPI0006CB4910|nr:SDR family oxidoreductase [Pseudonocardia sp. HH130629-09]ALE84163.1 diacetyl reductase [Pseudonocardia sp. HH130629-09]
MVTGAGRGIGRGIALRLSRDGHSVAVNDRDAHGATAVAEEIRAAGGTAVAYPADVTDPDAVTAMVGQVAEEPGGVDVMIDRRTGGKIVSAASIAGHQGFDLLGHYSATKFAVRALPQAAAKELAPHRITVNAYRPGIVGTDMWDLIDEQMGARSGAGRGETLKQYAAGIPLGRVQTADDVAAFVSDLAGPDSDYMTGQAVMIDGGVVMV